MMRTAEVNGALREASVTSPHLVRDLYKDERVSECCRFPSVILFLSLSGGVSSPTLTHTRTHKMLPCVRDRVAQIGVPHVRVFGA